MADLADAMINGKDIAAIDDIAKHKEWADMIMKNMMSLPKTATIF